jgi:hypothetical protein
MHFKAGGNVFAEAESISRQEANVFAEAECIPGQEANVFAEAECIPGQDAYSTRADDRSHAPRGNAALDAPRPGNAYAQRRARRDRAEHGNYLSNLRRTAVGSAAGVGVRLVWAASGRSGAQRQTQAGGDPYV